MSKYRKTIKKLRPYIVIVLISIIMVTAYAFLTRPEVKEVPYSEMVKYFRQKRISEVNITDLKITGKLSENQYAYTYAGNLLDVEYLNNNYIYGMMEKGRIKYQVKPADGKLNIMKLIPIILELSCFGILGYLMVRQMGQGAVFGKGKAQQIDPDKDVIKFEDVAGLYEEKTELMEVVDFLKNPDKYHEVGARIPKGILLVGPPGTGKTYISKAVAGEAGVPFYALSGSDFVEMFVGVGASRVRNLFEKAKKTAPCIVFIDEIDAVGRKRGAGLGGGNDEREQTLNQLLVEMDGFDESLGIIVLAATNRPDVLDSALLRPGRFDRQIYIGVPDIRGREDIIRIHSRNKPLSDEVSPEIIAKRTPGFTPADLENLLNEAALLAARRDDDIITMSDIEEATTKVIAGPAKKSRVITESERRLTAYHEAGHAVVMRSIPGMDPVHQITIIPRGQAGGFTMQLPEADKYFETKTEMKNEIVSLLGGRVSEALKLNDISTGASNDISRATAIARDMVTKYAFSEKLGPVSYSDSEEVFIGRDLSKEKNISDSVQEKIDEEIKNILEDAYKRCEDILKGKDAALERVAHALMEEETLNNEQFEKLYKGAEIK